MMKRLINYILILSGSAFQGLQKLLIITILFYVYGSEYAGEYASLVAIPTFISLFSGMGFASKLLKLLPKETLLKQKKFFSEIMFSCLLWLVISCGLLWVLHFIGLLEVELASILYVIVLSITLLIRHYYVATISYLKLFFFDSICMAISLVWIFFSKNADSYLMYVCLSLIVLMFLWYILVISKFSNRASFIKDKDVFQYSCNNVLSAGAMSLLPLVIESLYGTATTGEVMVLLSFFSVFLLLSRAFANYSTPKLVYSVKVSMGQFVHDSKVFCRRYNVATLIFFIFALLIVAIANDPVFHMYNKFENISFHVQVLILILVFSSSLGVSQGILLFVLGKQIYSVYSNIFYFVICCFMFIVIDNVAVNVSLSVVLLVLSFFSAIRYPYLRYCSFKSIEKLSKGV
jgi:O-antigen/teichoic acid export membrane protein